MRHSLPPTPEVDDPRLARLTEICMALPEAERAQQGLHADFRVRKKVFAYYLDNHHGDGIVCVCCKGELGENVDRVSRDPERYTLPAYIHHRGWFGSDGVHPVGIGYRARARGIAKVVRRCHS